MHYHEKDCVCDISKTVCDISELKFPGFWAAVVFEQQGWKHPGSRGCTSSKVFRAERVNHKNATYRHRHHSRVQARSRGGRWAGLSRRVGLSLEGPGEIKRGEVMLDPQESPGEIKSREAELGSEICTVLCFSCYSTAVLRTLSLWLCSAQQLKQQLAEYTSCFALARSPLLNIAVVLAVVHGLFGLLRVGLRGRTTRSLSLVLCVAYASDFTWGLYLNFICLMFIYLFISAT